MKALFAARATMNFDETKSENIRRGLGFRVLRMIFLWEFRVEGSKCLGVWGVQGLEGRLSQTQGPEP